MLALPSCWRVEGGVSAMGLVYIQEKTEKSMGFKMPCRVHHPSPLSNRDFGTKYRRTKKSHVPHKGQLFLKNQAETVLTKEAGRRA